MKREPATTTTIIRKALMVRPKKGRQRGKLFSNQTSETRSKNEKNTTALVKSRMAVLGGEIARANLDKNAAQVAYPPHASHGPHGRTETANRREPCESAGSPTREAIRVRPPAC